MSSLGTLVRANGDEASYLVRWTDRRKSEGIAFLLQPPGSSAFVSVLYSFEHDSFMVVGPDGYDWQSTEVLILERDEVVGTELASLVFECLDEIWMEDPNLQSFIAQ